MAIPAFNEHGHLPTGVHRASLEEIVARFCKGHPSRGRLETPLRLLVEVAGQIPALALYLNGSFVSAKEQPGDFDAVIVLPEHFDTQSPQADRLRQIYRQWRCDIERVQAADEEGLRFLLDDFFGTDRDGNPKGLLEVSL